MKNYLHMGLLALLSFGFWAEATDTWAQAPAFPGAEGYARYTTSGGRGGTVVHVTNLNDRLFGLFHSAPSIHHFFFLIGNFVLDHVSHLRPFQVSVKEMHGKINPLHIFSLPIGHFFRF